MVTLKLRLATPPTSRGHLGGNAPVHDSGAAGSAVGVPPNTPLLQPAEPGDQGAGQNT